MTSLNFFKDDKNYIRNPAWLVWFLGYKKIVVNILINNKRMNKIKMIKRQHQHLLMSYVGIGSTHITFIAR